MVEHLRVDSARSDRDLGEVPGVRGERHAHALPEQAAPQGVRRTAPGS